MDLFRMFFSKSVNLYHGTTVEAYNTIIYEGEMTAGRAPGDYWLAKGPTFAVENRLYALWYALLSAWQAWRKANRDAFGQEIPGKFNFSTLKERAVVMHFSWTPPEGFNVLYLTREDGLRQLNECYEDADRNRNGRFWAGQYPSTQGNWDA